MGQGEGGGDQVTLIPALFSFPGAVSIGETRIHHLASGRIIWSAVRPTSLERVMRCPSCPLRTVSQA